MFDFGIRAGLMSQRDGMRQEDDDCDDDDDDDDDLEDV